MNTSDLPRGKVLKADMQQICVDDRRLPLLIGFEKGHSLYESAHKKIHTTLICVLSYL